MAYPYLNGTLLGDNLAYMFSYANDVTGGIFGNLLMVSWFLMDFLGTAFGQYRLRGYFNASASFLAASFTSLLFSLVLLTEDGIINASWAVGMTVTTIVAYLMVTFSDKEENY